jgi:hypothetical protein
MILLSSLLTNAPAVGQRDNPNYKFLNLLGGVLDHKLVAEKYLRQSGLDWTVVRPGGLSNEPADQVSHSKSFKLRQGWVGRCTCVLKRGGAFYHHNPHR